MEGLGQLPFKEKQCKAKWLDDQLKECKRCYQVPLAEREGLAVTTNGDQRLVSSEAAHCCIPSTLNALLEVVSVLTWILALCVKSTPILSLLHLQSFYVVFSAISQWRMIRRHFIFLARFTPCLYCIYQYEKGSSFSKIILSK